MEFLQEFLPIVLYCSLIVFVIILIVLAIKAIGTLNKVNTLIDDAQEKLDSLNGVFHIVDTVTDRVSFITDTLVSTIGGAISKFFQRRKEKKEE